MKLSSFLNPDFIILKNPALTTKEEVIHALFQKIYREFQFELGQEDILKAIFDRESLGGTVFPTGIAVPHARLDKFDDLLIGICVPKNPIVLDKTEVRFFALILTSKTASKTYLNTLAALMQISQNDELMSKLTATDNGEEFVEIIKNADIRIKKELTIADIMTDKVVKVSPQTTIKELADIFYKNNIGYAPIVNEQDVFLGEVNVLDLIKLGIPNYATMIGNLKFLSSFEPFEELLKNEDKITVNDIMRKPSLFFEPSTSIIEAVLEFTQSKRRHVTVVKDNKVLGVISFMDILNKVLRG